MSKIEAGRTTLNPTTFDLPDLLDDLEMMFRVRTDGKRLSFVGGDGSATSPGTSWPTSTSSARCFINVLGQCREVHRGGGIGLRVRSDRDDGSCGPILQVEVEDTGPGISPDEQDKLFRHFEQTKTGQQAGTGTGLGLAISREFVRLMGGDITVSSQVGKGSVFAIQPPPERGRGAGGPSRKTTPTPCLKPDRGRRPAGSWSSTTSRTIASCSCSSSAPVGFEVRLACDGEQAVAEFASLAAPPDPDGLPDAGDGRPRGDPPGSAPRTGGDGDPRSSR